MEQRDNTFILFTNSKKEKDNQPDFQGNMLVDGVKKQISGWKKTDRNGNLFITGQVSEPFQGKIETKEFTEVKDTDDLPF